MKIAIIGGGGREHAIVKSIRNNKSVEKIYCIPGNDGMANDCEITGISATDFDSILSFIRLEGVEYVIISPDNQLVDGLADKINALGVPVFGPERSGAMLEGSKAFAKGLMKKYSIPTADYKVFDDLNEAISYAKSQGVFPLVIKADGLALGKGVIIAQNKTEAEEALLSFMSGKSFGDSGRTVVIEEFMQGVEISLLTLCDGKTILPLPSSMDHKKIYEGDKGLNTGGMGAIAPCPFFDEKMQKEFMDKIALPTLRAIQEEHLSYCGCLYFGLMNTAQGLKVVEFNCRFGDPETQAVLPLLSSDLFSLMLATTQRRLSQTEIKTNGKSSCCVVLASLGYPLAYKKGYPITINGEVDGQLCFAGVKLDAESKLCTNGGRVLSLTTAADSLQEAIDGCYAQIDKVRFEGSYMRRDIGKSALSYQKKI